MYTEYTWQCCNQYRGGIMKKLLQCIGIFVALAGVGTILYAVVSGYPIKTGPFPLTILNKTDEQLQVLVRTVEFDPARERQFVQYKEGKWIYSSTEAGSLETMVALGHSVHTLLPGATYRGTFSHAITLITARSPNAEASKSVPPTFDLKTVTIEKDAMGSLVINFS